MSVFHTFNYILYLTFDVMIYKHDLVTTNPFSYGIYRAHVLLCFSPLIVKDFVVISSAVNYHWSDVRRDKLPSSVNN